MKLARGWVVCCVSSVGLSQQLPRLLWVVCQVWELHNSYPTCYEWCVKCEAFTTATPPAMSGVWSVWHSQQLPHLLWVVCEVWELHNSYPSYFAMHACIVVHCSKQDQEAARIALERLAAMDLENDEVSTWFGRFGHQIAVSEYARPIGCSDRDKAACCDGFRKWRGEHLVWSSWTPDSRLRIWMTNRLLRSQQSDSLRWI